MIEEITQSVFSSGFEMSVYIRRRGYALLLRPKRIPNNKIFNAIDDNQTLLFEGHLNGPMFSVEDIHIIPKPQRKQEFEKEETVIPTNYASKNESYRIQWLYDLKNTLPEEVTEKNKNLEQWKEYLDWQANLVKVQLHGIKYIISFVRQTGKSHEDPRDDLELALCIYAKNKDTFEEFRKYLKRDICLFTNDISASRFDFDVLNAKGLPRANSLQIGDFKTIEKEGLFREEFPDYEDEHIRNNPDCYGAIVTYKLGKLAPSKKEINKFLNNKDNKKDDVYKFIEDKANKELKKKDKKEEHDFQNGFLALSAVGDFALIRRLQYAIKDFEEGKFSAYSPTLKNWLFDITKARISNQDELIEVENYLNESVKNNEHQREALKKIINAIDVCLVQGPPGTGKTTLIAEVIYQFVIRGKSVLLASQSNDAVDNALERLADVPEINAVRLNSKSREKDEDEDSDEQDDKKDDYSEEKIVNRYYSSLARRIETRYFTVWEKADSEDFDLLLNKAKLLQKDIADFSVRLENENAKLADIENKLQTCTGNKNSLDSDIKLKKNEIRQLENFKKNTGNDFYFSDEIISHFTEGLSQSIKQIKEAGINFEDITSNESLQKAIEAKTKILTCVDSILNTDKIADSTDNSEREKLQTELTNIENKMNQTDDDDELLKLLKTQKILKKELSNLSPSISVPKELFSEQVYKDLKTGKENTALTIQSIMLNFEKSLLNVANELLESAQNRLDEKQKELDSTENELKRLIGQKKAQKENCDNSQRVLNQKKNEFIKTCNLPKDFSFGEDVAETCQNEIQHLKERKNEYKRQNTNTKKMRSVWEDSIRKFDSLLKDEKQIDYDNQDKNYKGFFVKSANVVGTSCTVNTKKFEDKEFFKFDVAIIDEVSKATPVELLIPLLRARTVILVGDHRQLPPMFKEHEQSYKDLFDLRDTEEDSANPNAGEDVATGQENLIQSDEMPQEVRNLMTLENFRKFENMVTSSLFKEYFENAPNEIKHSLFTQYRMHHDITEVINRFYENKLENGFSKEEAKEKKKHSLNIKGVDGSQFIVRDRHAYWIDSSSFPDGTPFYEEFRENSTSATNVLEQYIILELVKKIAAEYAKMGRTKENPVSVGIISFYQRQVNETRKLIREERRINKNFEALDIDVNTVDRFQGQEKNIIITSLVRNNKNARGSRHIVAFERINVAFSRAQNMLVIIGAKHMYETQKVLLPKMDGAGARKVPVYQQIFSLLRNNGCFCGTEKILDKEAVRQIKKSMENAR